MSEGPLVRELRDDEVAWARALLEERWSLPLVSVSGVHDPTHLLGLVAEVAGRRVGLLTYRLTTGECEVVTLDALVARRGVGTALLEAVRARAGDRVVWLITTDENAAAISFYVRAGMRLVARHEDFVATVSRHKDFSERPGGAGFRDALEFRFDAGAADRDP